MRKTCQKTVTASPRVLQRFLTEARWDDDAVIGRLPEYRCSRLEHPQAVWVLDGSDFPKQGVKSAGVARQYCGALGKIANCQAGVFLAQVGPRGRALADKRLYLPEEWTGDGERCATAGVPANRREYQSKTELAMDMLECAQARGHLSAQWVAGEVESKEAGKREKRAKPVTAADLERIRDTACNPRKTDRGSERFSNARRRGLVDIALTSVMRVPRQLWPVEVVPNGGPVCRGTVRRPQRRRPTVFPQAEEDLMGTEYLRRQIGHCLSTNPGDYTIAKDLIEPLLSPWGSGRLGFDRRDDFPRSAGSHHDIYAYHRISVVRRDVDPTGCVDDRLDQ